MRREPQSLATLLVDPQIITLVALLLGATAMLYFFGFQLIPFIAAFVIAYFLDGGVQQLTRRNWSRGRAVALVYAVYLVVYILLFLGPVPLVAKRAVEAARDLPGNADQLVRSFQALPDPSLGLLPPELHSGALNLILQRTQAWFSAAVSESLGLIPQVTGWIVFVFLVPLLVFFLLKDKARLIQGCTRCLPRNRTLVTRIATEMETQLGNYLRGKIWEIVIVGVATWLVFWLLGFRYPVVFGMLSGVSVVVPYVGAIGLAIPVFVQGYLQWGLGSELAWLMAAYTIIQFIDGNVLVPYIFSEAVKLHPISILLAVFLFGSLWGFWGVFFAIPLATLAKSLLNAVLDYREGAADEEPAAP